MSVFKKVVGRVRGFFLEPETKGQPPRPATGQSPPPARPARPSADKTPDAFEWEPPPKWRATPEAEPSLPLVPLTNSAADPGPRPAGFSVRNFSTEELQRSSVLDIVEGAARVPTRPIPPLPGPDPVAGLP